MSWRLWIMSGVARLFFKFPIAHIKNLPWLRRYLGFVMRVAAVSPKDVVYEKSTLTYKSRTVPVLWAYGPLSREDHVLLYIHGGGFIFGSADTHKHLAADIAKRLGLKTVLPNYALAPENPYPKGFEDSVACYQALLEMGYPPNRIIIAGDSAGGNLTFALLAYIKANGLPKPACAFTFAALTDLTGTSESLVRNARTECVLVARRFDDMKSVYALDQDIKSPYLSPVFADFSGMPPILMQAAKDEILIDDSRAMLDALKRQKVEAHLSVFNNGFHVFQELRGFVPEADQALSEVTAFVEKHIGDEPIVSEPSPPHAPLTQS